jgi:hypothetical protein
MPDGTASRLQAKMTGLKHLFQTTPVNITLTQININVAFLNRKPTI